MKSPLAIHVDLDGATHIFRAHGRTFPGAVDSIYTTGMENMLAFFDEQRVRATLFLIAEDVRDAAKRALLQEALARGHELASHTLTHPNLLRLTSAQKERELVDSKALIEDTFGVRVTGFRAPGYAMDAEALTILGRADYVYDSSAFPTAVFAQRLRCAVSDLRQPHRFTEYAGIVELPLPGPAPRTMPLGPSLSIAFGIPGVQWTMARAARRAVPTALLFHLVDFAAPLDRALRGGARLSLFTLSTRSAKAKRRRCTRMMAFVRARFSITPTMQLLAPVMAGATHAAS